MAHRDYRRRGSLVLVAGAILAGMPGQVLAEDCGRLYAAIQAADAGPSGPSAWDRAAEQQRREIVRTQRYADQLGCGGGSGLFGSDDPPQCGAVEDRLRRMEDNLAGLEAQNQNGSQVDAQRRAALLARYNGACIGPAVASPADAARDRGYLPDDGRNPAGAPADDDLSTVPLNGDIMDENGGGTRRSGQPICVRTCDGGWFPLAASALQDQAAGLDQLCQASCPNTEARLYTMARADDLASATTAEGDSYTALAAAFKFEKTFTPTCSCKPPGKSWAEALAEAETLLGTADRHDITVTASLSDQMARPGPAPAGKTGKASQRAGRAGPDLSAARDAQKALQAPTASSDTSGIGGPVRATRVVRQGDGEVIAVDGANGAKKRIRLIVP